MNTAIVSAIEQRISANCFDESRYLSSGHIGELVRLATCAPTAFNLQNWRFIAVHTPAAKARLRKVAHDQPKIGAAAVTFIVIGQSPTHDVIADRLRASVDAGFMPPAMAQDWESAARETYLERPQAQRDEAFRSATLGAATLMYAAAGFGLVSGAMAGFDPEGVAGEFGLGADEVPVMLLAVGYPGAGNWPQKPRRPVSQVLDFA